MVMSDHQGLGAKDLGGFSVSVHVHTSFLSFELRVYLRLGPYSFIEFSGSGILPI
jgi:hypothetical protein